MSSLYCCYQLKVYWYHISEDRAIIMCTYWVPHDKNDFMFLGEI